jgi:hypothetical protein
MAYHVVHGAFYVQLGLQSVVPGPTGAILHEIFRLDVAGCHQLHWGFNLGTWVHEPDLDSSIPWLWEAASGYFHYPYYHCILHLAGQGHNLSLFSWRCCALWYWSFTWGDPRTRSDCRYYVLARARSLDGSVPVGFLERSNGERDRRSDYALVR